VRGRAGVEFASCHWWIDRAYGCSISPRPPDAQHVAGFNHAHGHDSLARPTPDRTSAERQPPCVGGTYKVTNLGARQGCYDSMH
jgi:hypothetical protein